MEQEIYRGKRIYNNDWIYGELIHSYGKRGEPAIITYVDFSDHSERKIYSIKKYTISKSTGIKAYYGGYIFENDIVVHPNDLSHILKGVVKLKDKGFVVEVPHIGCYTLEADKYIIVGNIYDDKIYI